MNGWTHRRSMNKWMADDHIDVCTDICIKGWVTESLAGCLVGWIDGWMDRSTAKWNDGLIEKWMRDGWVLG